MFYLKFFCRATGSMYNDWGLLAKATLSDGQPCPEGEKSTIKVVFKPQASLFASNTTSAWLFYSSGHTSYIKVFPKNILKWFIYYCFGCTRPEPTRYTPNETFSIPFECQRPAIFVGDANVATEWAVPSNTHAKLK